MDSKHKDGQRLKVLSELGNLPKTKGKEKARKELWDSLCAVYENEADKDSEEDVMEEVEVSELEKWTETNTNTSMRALTHLAVTNPLVVSAAAPLVVDDADLKFELGLEKEHEANENKRKEAIRSTVTKNCKCKSSSITKTKKTISSAKKCKKPRLLSQEEKSANTLKKKIDDKKSRLSKKVKESYVTEKDSKIYRKERTSKKEKRTHLDDSKKHMLSNEVCKSKNKHKNLQIEAEEVEHSTCKCKLELRHYLSSRNICMRPDKRVFQCKLIFKICHCSESNYIL